MPTRRDFDKNAILVYCKDGITEDELFKNMGAYTTNSRHKVRLLTRELLRDDKLDRIGNLKYKTITQKQ